MSRELCLLFSALSLVVLLALGSNESQADPSGHVDEDAVAATDDVHVWQFSNSLAVRLGARDKFGESSFRAHFIVTAPDGTEYTSTTTVLDDEFGYVYFPHDFQTALKKPGNYSWACYNGTASRDDMIGSGGFIISSNDGGYSNQLTIERF